MIITIQLFHCVDTQSFNVLCCNGDNEYIHNTAVDSR